MGRWNGFSFGELLELQAGTFPQREIQQEIFRREHPAAQRCNCPVGAHEVGPSGDRYATHPDGVEVDVYYCASGCGRMSCTASESGYSAHCCKVCAESAGGPVIVAGAAQHSALCSENHAWMAPRIRKRAAA